MIDSFGWLCLVQMLPDGFKISIVKIFLMVSCQRRHRRNRICNRWIAQNGFRFSRTVSPDKWRNQTVRLLHAAGWIYGRTDTSSGSGEKPKCCKFGTKFHLREFQNGNDVKSAPFLKKFTGGEWLTTAILPWFLVYARGKFNFWTNCWILSKTLDSGALLQHSCNSIAEIMKTREFLSTAMKKSACSAACGSSCRGRADSGESEIHGRSRGKWDLRRACVLLLWAFGSYKLTVVKVLSRISLVGIIRGIRKLQVLLRWQRNC